MFGNKKQFKIFRVTNNTNAGNKDSKNSNTGGDKGVATCTASSSKTFLSDAVTQNNKKMNGAQNTSGATVPIGNNQVFIASYRLVSLHGVISVCIL